MDSPEIPVSIGDLITEISDVSASLISNRSTLIDTILGVLYRSCKCIRRDPTAEYPTTPSRKNPAGPPQAMRVSEYFTWMLSGIQDIHDSSTLRSKTYKSKCHTKDTGTHLKVIPARYTRVRPRALGGLSRVYDAVDSVTGTLVVVKITENSGHIGSAEIRWYGVLAGLGLDVPEVYYSNVTDGYAVIVMERMQCTLTAAIAALSASPNSSIVKYISTYLKHATRVLRDNGVVFVDLTPDNVMCRVSGGHLECVLIDPQFARYSSDPDFDAVHICCRLAFLASTEHGHMIRDTSTRISKDLIGRVPSTAEIRQTQKKASRLIFTTCLTS